jgi:hypothetical protein
VPSSARPKKAVVPELEQRIQVFGALQSDIAASAAVSTAGSATRNELLAPEGNTTISTVTAGNVDLGLVNEHVACTTP